jgi:cytochrome c peroxidase
MPASPAHWTVPAGFPNPIYLNTSHQNNNAVYELGRKLFYDPVLSVDSSISCASCHLQSYAFSDTIAYSKGILSRQSLRNSPPLFNLAWKPHFMRDGGINHLDLVPIAPITDSLEMGIPFKALLNRLQKDTYYRKAFQHTWQTDTITDQYFLWSLGHFMAALVSANSPYDHRNKGNENALSPSAERGMAIFQEKCAGCHKPPLFTDYSFRKNGTASQDGDPGRYRITKLVEDYGSFEVPSLRNIALTAPYMHDGRYKTLREVLEHYQTGIQSHTDIDELLRGGLLFNAQEKNDLLAFLNALTDTQFIENKAFGPPDP